MENEELEQTQQAGQTKAPTPKPATPRPTPKPQGAPGIVDNIVGGITDTVGGAIRSGRDALFGDETYRTNKANKEREDNISELAHRNLTDLKKWNENIKRWNQRRARKGLPPKPLAIGVDAKTGAYKYEDEKKAATPTAPKGGTPSTPAAPQTPSGSQPGRVIPNAIKSESSMQSTGEGSMSTSRRRIRYSGQGGSARGTGSGQGSSSGSFNTTGLFAEAREVAEGKAETGKGGLQAVQDKAYAQYGFKMDGGKLVNTQTGRSAEDTREARNRAQDLSGRLKEVYDSHYEMAKAGRKTSTRVEDPNYE